LSPILETPTRTRRIEMGFMDSLREALAGDPDSQPATPPASVAHVPRHLDREAPAELADDIVTPSGGKHARRD
jgi:hypothetical protein